MGAPFFDIAKYKAERSRIIEKIKATHDWKNTEGFIADGIICPNIYDAQRFKILCVLEESYGWADCGIQYIETQPTDDILGVSKVPSVRNCASFLWLLQQSLDSGTKFTWDAFRSQSLFTANKQNKAVLQSALSKVAWINVKKASRAEGTQCDPEEIYEQTLRNKDIIQEQIDSIAPHLIIVCSQPVFRSLHALKLLGEKIELARKWQIQASNGFLVLEVSHPSRWFGYEFIYKRFEDVYCQLASLDLVTSRNPKRDVR